MPTRTPTTAWHNGNFVPAEKLFVPVDDAGFRQGVIAVERLRTYDGRVTAVESHVVRWRRTLEELYLTIAVDVDEIRLRIDRLLSENKAWIDDVGDCGIVMLATPGSLHASDPVHAFDPVQRANEMMHLIPIDHQKIARHRSEGQPLFITDVEQPSGNCWPRDIKVRCRLHYYLADQQARDHHPDAVGLLIDQDGTITETSVANLAIVRKGKIISPSMDQVLPGITQELVQQVSAEAGMEWQYGRLWPAEIREADEVWMMGTDGGLWFANRVDGAKVAGEQAGALYSRFLPLFDRLVRRN